MSFKTEREGDWPTQPPKLTPTEQRVVDYLRVSGHASAKALARACFRGPTYEANAARVTEKLEAKGVIRRRHLQTPRFGIRTFVWEMVPGVPE